jgi:hypothetical protein
MANIIKPKRSNTAAKVPTTTELISGELGVNMADRKVYINNGTAVVQVGAGNLGGLGDVAIATPTNGQALTYNTTTSKWVNSAAGTGTVTSVATGSGLTGGPITTSGTVSLATAYGDTVNPYASKTANNFLAAPNGSAGVPTFRAIVAADIPTLNQNTTGNAATATSSPLLSALGSYVWSQSTLPTSYSAGIQSAFVGPAVGEGSWQNYGSVMTMRTYPGGGGSLQLYVPYGPSNGGTGLQVRFGDYNVSSGNAWTAWKTLLASDNYNSYAPTLTGTGASGSWGISVTGTSANVTGTVAVANGGTGATTAGSARTSLGATTLGANVFTVPNVTAIAFPRFNADNTVSTLDAASFRTAIGAGTGNGNGTVTSVATSGTVSGLTLTGGTITTTGTITLGGTLAVTPSNFASQTANTVLAAPNAAAGVPTFRLLVASDIPTLNQNTTGSAATLTTGRTIAMTGDVAYTSSSFNGSANVTGTATLANSGVTAGSYTYTSITVDAKGRVTSASSGSTPSAFPAGTAMLFVQTAAPTGWTKSTTHNNKALRVVSGTATSGGSVAFTTAFASQGVSGSIANATAGGSVSISGGSVSATTLSTSEIPAHSHGASAGDTTNFDSGSFFAGMSSSNRTNNTNNAGGGGSHTHGFTAPSGSFTGTAHNHTFTGTAINLAVSYVDVIIATKD